MYFIDANNNGINITNNGKNTYRFWGNDELPNKFYEVLIKSFTDISNDEESKEIEEGPLVNTTTYRWNSIHPFRFDFTEDESYSIHFHDINGQWFTLNYYNKGIAIDCEFIYRVTIQTNVSISLTSLDLKSLTLPLKGLMELNKYMYKGNNAVYINDIKYEYRDIPIWRTFCCNNKEALIEIEELIKKHINVEIGDENHYVINYKENKAYPDPLGNRYGYPYELTLSHCALNNAIKDLFLDVELIDKKYDKSDHLSEDESEYFNFYNGLYNKLKHGMNEMDILLYQACKSKTKNNLYTLSDVDQFDLLKEVVDLVLDGVITFQSTSIQVKNTPELDEYLNELEKRLGISNAEYKAYKLLKHIHIGRKYDKLIKLIPYPKETPKLFQQEKINDLMTILNTKKPNVSMFINLYRKRLTMKEDLTEIQQHEIDSYTTTIRNLI